MSTKKCRDCGHEKSVDLFSKDKSKRDGLVSYCKPCASIRAKNYYSKNSDAIKMRASAWYHDNTEKHKDRCRLWLIKNRDSNLKRRRDYHSKRYKENTEYRISHILRASVRRAVVACVSDKEFDTFSLLGYTPEKLMERMEVQFSKGMSWDNYGDWEIDHKIPMSIMISRGETNPSKIHMLSNLQPLWKSENRSKGARYIG